MATIILLGTCDTKLEELLFLRSQILLTPGLSIVLLDVGRRPTSHPAITVSQSDLVTLHGDGTDPSSLPRGELIKYMSTCAGDVVLDYFNPGNLHGIIAAGGSSGTALAAPIMRDKLPIGFPKLIVSTVASGDTGPVVGEADITMMYSVVDVAGLNQVLRDVLSNAGAAIAGMALGYARRLREAAEEARGGKGELTKKRVGITMFGVTTPGVDAIRKHLETNYAIETFVFHATGHGGKSMERLVHEGKLDAVVDLTTTEICDHITGGVLSAGPYRLEAIMEKGIPAIISLGALDMTNWGPRDTVPERYKARKLYEHNPMVTLMRTNVEEAEKIAEFMCRKLKMARNPDLVRVVIPRGGVSMISTVGGPFEDREADQVLFDSLVNGLKETGIKVIEDWRDVNDPGLASDIATALAEMMHSETEGRTTRFVGPGATDSVASK